MKKQFNRMKQLANQTVGRAEKTEVLSDDLLQIERRVESVRTVSHNVHKKMQACLQGQVGADVDKRHKKLPVTALAQAMKDGSGHLGDESLIGKMMDLCGEAEDKLAYDQSQHEVEVQRDILDPINQLAEVDIPNILKQRKQLAKLVLDYDSAKARYFQASKSMVSGTNHQALLAKVKDEMDEALNKVEICKDQLAADMYNFFSKEGDYARYYVMFLESQAEYHRRSLDIIESVLPSIKSQQDSWTEQPAFGSPLEDHLKRSGRDIALPIEACVMMLLETGMREEGLFRIAAGASKLKKLKAALDCSTSQLEDFYSDPHAVAGALKSYLRELPEPLMTFHLYDEWTQASSIPDQDTRLQALWVTCDKMPKHNKANFKYLIKFLAKLSQESDINKMTPSNIAIVLGPNLLWAKTEGSLAEMAAATSVHVVTIIEPIIIHADWFFPDEVEFNVSGMFTAPSHQTIHPTSPGPLDPEVPPTLERRRPGSLTGPSEGGSGGGETPRKDSPANKQSEPGRRVSSSVRKQPFTSPPFQPPQPPSAEEAGSGLWAESPAQAESSPLGWEGGQDGPLPPAGALVLQALQQQLQQQFQQQTAEQESSVGSREMPAPSPVSTPHPQRNGPPAGTPSQLNVGVPASGSRGPSPLSHRRGTKKQAPAPPKPSQAVSSQAPPLSPTPATFPSVTPCRPAPTPNPNPSPVPAPRRPSSSQPPFQSPSHPPPQPPQGGSGSSSGASSIEPDPSPPRTPTPPGTPPHDSSLQSGSLPRPKPAPRPRPRPSVPPPPNPPTNGVCSSSSKIITDGNLKMPGRAFVPYITANEGSQSPPPEPEIQQETTIF